MDAGRHHLVNAGLHGVNLLLLVWIIRRLTGEFLPALVAGALFALHPLRVESVAWISERKDVLSTMFWLLSIAAYGFWVKRPKYWKYLLLVLFFALGLLSKAMLVTLPFTLLLLDLWPLRRLEAPNRFNDPAFISNFRGLVWEKIPLFAIAAAFCWVALHTQRSAGAVTDLAALPLPIRVQTALVAYAGYLGKFFWPVNLACVYPHPGSWPWWMVASAVVVLVMMVLPPDPISGTALGRWSSLERAARLSPNRLLWAGRFSPFPARHGRAFEKISNDLRAANLWGKQMSANGQA
jgi:hypothetical protein